MDGAREVSVEMEPPLASSIVPVYDVVPHLDKWGERCDCWADRDTRSCILSRDNVSRHKREMRDRISPIASAWGFIGSDDAAATSVFLDRAEGHLRLSATAFLARPTAAHPEGRIQFRPQESMRSETWLELVRVNYCSALPHAICGELN